MERINIVDCPLRDVRKHLGRYGSIFIIHDRNVGGLVENLGIEAKGILPIEATEAKKTLATVLETENWLLEKGADRQAFVLAIGGGITTDLAGFAASVYKRGVRFGFIPTTLLSQVDAAIGGKNGVNLDSYKNIIGVIRQPEMTFICPEPLETLPYPQILSGAAELLKTFIINNEGGEYERAVNMLEDIHSQASGKVAIREYSETLRSLIAAAARIKAGIAGRDPNEHGERRLLNLGHTFAHAIEKNSGERIAHGEAVAMGIILAAQLSESLGLAEGLAERLKADFTACGLPVRCPYSIDTLADAMKKDKKSEGAFIHFVLPLGIGHVETRELSVEDAVKTLQASNL
jgi:3-dehydroquinate synthase